MHHAKNPGPCQFQREGEKKGKCVQQGWKWLGNHQWLTRYFVCNPGQKRAYTQKNSIEKRSLHKIVLTIQSCWNLQKVINFVLSLVKSFHLDMFIISWRDTSSIFLMKKFLKGLVYVRFARTLSFLSMTEAQSFT